MQAHTQTHTHTHMRTPTHTHAHAHTTPSASNSMTFHTLFFVYQRSFQVYTLLQEHKKVELSEHRLPYLLSLKD